ncbi:MAG: pyridoxine 5'-phosphate synthase, partial [Campylobacterales bacterium]
CSINQSIIDIVCELRPHRATLVPENREEVTTEGGLDVIGQSAFVSDAIDQLHDAGIAVSLFVDPSAHIMEQSKDLDAEMVELHTGTYANLFAMLNTSLPYTRHSIPELELPRDDLQRRLEASVDAIRQSAEHAQAIGLEVAAGHGLNYHNVAAIAAIAEITELNIGQSIIARSVFSGLGAAVRDMKALLAR